MKKAKIRLDVKLVELGFADDLKEAQARIMAGDVSVDNQRCDKPGTLLKAEQIVKAKDRSRFVSRGGDKLWGAVEDLGLAPVFADAVVLDCGASTGGFTDCALQLGARSVYAIEIGFNQLAWKLRTDPRVISKEGTDIRTFAYEAPDDLGISIVVADISFSPLNRLLNAIVSVKTENPTHYLLLVKPQFELDNDQIPDTGVVNDPHLQELALERVSQGLAKEGLKLCATAESRVKGREGNQEVFVHAMRQY